MAKRKTGKAGRVLAFVSSKGGSGKTTLAASVAGELLRRGRQVTLLDTDTQAVGGLAQWHASGPGLSAAPLLIEAGEAAGRVARDAAESGATVIADAAGAFTRTTLALLDAADVVVIPTRPSGLDALRAVEVARTAKEVCAGEVVVVLNACARSALPDHIRSELRKAGLKVLRTTIGNRTAFAVAALHGFTPADMGSAASKAAAEVDALVNELERI